MNMILKDVFKKKERIQDNVTPAVVDPPPQQESPPPFTIMRSDTNTQELIRPPTFAEDSTPATPVPPEENSLSKRLSRFRSPSNASQRMRSSSNVSISSKGEKAEKRLSQRLHLHRNGSQTSVNVPSDLPDIRDLSIEAEEKEAKWEERATILANSNPNTRPESRDDPSSRPVSPSRDSQSHDEARLGDRPSITRSVSSAKADENIQEAIRLHESGDLIASTAMFGRLADGNAMAQIMYGLALRHGWGIPPDPPLAIQYLSRAAASSANIESAALSSGMKKGGAAKGELVLAIYELANSFRHGWGVEKDAVAARKYYETAANLGDTDAMNEVARCYDDGYGGKKDRVSRLLFTYFPIIGIMSESLSVMSASRALTVVSSIFYGPSRNVSFDIRASPSPTSQPHPRFDALDSTPTLASPRSVTSSHWAAIHVRSNVNIG